MKTKRPTVRTYAMARGGFWGVIYWPNGSRDNVTSGMHVGFKTRDAVKVEANRRIESVKSN